MAAFFSDTKWLLLFVSCTDFFFSTDSHLWMRYYNFLCLLFLIMTGYWCKCSFIWLVSVRKRHCRHTWLKNISCNPLSLIHGTSNNTKSKKDTKKKLEHLKAQTLEILEEILEKKARTLQCISGSSKCYLKASQPEGGFPSENSKCWCIWRI